MEPTERRIVEEQFGFRKDENCTEKVFVVGQLCEKSKENKKSDFSRVHGHREGRCQSGQRGYVASTGDLWCRGKSVDGHKEFL